MRKIGELPAEQAELFSNTLYVQGVENDVESEDHGACSIWVHDDDLVAKGRELLEAFRANPGDPQWAQAASSAATKRKEEARAADRAGSNVITRERMEYERNFAGFAWVPFLLTILSIVATLWAGEIDMMLGSNTRHLNTEEKIAQRELEHRRDMLRVTAMGTVIKDAQARGMRDEDGDIVRPKGFFYSLREIRHGEVWRLITPIFLHFGILHILFNVLWLRDLGGFMQHRFGAAYLLVFIAATAAVSNLVQLAVAGPNFGGLSGVNYGLLGFLWIRGRFDHSKHWQINPQVVQMMLAWLVMCFFIGGIANGSHVAGLGFGMLCGFLTAKIANARRRTL